jgi:hypothetical protein
MLNERRVFSTDLQPWRIVRMVPVNTKQPNTLASQFAALAGEWKTATALLSSSTAISNHPAYRAIIALGPPVVPLILRDLEQEPAHWFEALQAITGEDPVPAGDWGKIQAMRQAWLAWGRSQGLI